MYCVVDASIAAAWVIEDEKDALTDALLERVEAKGAGIPDLFWHEIRNILLKIERRGRSAPGAAEAAIAQLRQLSLTILAVDDGGSLLALARDHALTSYDAAYLAAATGSGLPLATADRRLAAAARALGVTVLGPLAP